MGTVAQESIGTTAVPGAGVARDGADSAAKVGSDLSRDQRTGALCRFNNDGHLRQGRDDPVSSREGPPKRSDPRRQLGENHSPLCQLAMQSLTPRRVGALRPTGQYSDRSPTASQRPFVRGAVNPKCHAAYDAHAAERKRAPQLACQLKAVGRCTSRPD